MSDINNVEGKEIKAICNGCGNDAYHNVLKSVWEKYDDDEDVYKYFSGGYYQIIQCKGCKNISFRATVEGENDDTRETLYPIRINGDRRVLPKHSRYIPEIVSDIYREALLAIGNQMNVLAGIGLRALIEAIYKNKYPEGKDKSLKDKIDRMDENGDIHKSGTPILHQIRELGNASAHDLKGHNERDLTLALMVLETVMMNIYIFPNEAHQNLPAVKIKPQEK